MVKLFQIAGAQRLKAREPLTVGREVTDGVADGVDADEVLDVLMRYRKPLNTAEFPKALC